MLHSCRIVSNALTGKHFTSLQIDATYHCHMLCPWKNIWEADIRCCCQRYSNVFNKISIGESSLLCFQELWYTRLWLPCPRAKIFFVVDGCITWINRDTIYPWNKWLEHYIIQWTQELSHMTLFQWYILDSISRMYLSIISVAAQKFSRTVVFVEKE